jgi:hypothetical protein
MKIEKRLSFEICRWEDLKFELWNLAQALPANEQGETKQKYRKLQ